MKTVLIVDDNAIDRLIHRRVLERIKRVRETHVASDGVEALALLKDYFQRDRSLPDIILLDLNMPVMDGFTFIDGFRGLPLPGKDNVTIAIVTSSRMVSDMDRAKEMGIDVYLEKPLTVEKFLEIIT